MTGPYVPAPFASPAVNPAVGGAGVPIAYASNSQFGNAPTSIDTADLVPDGNASAQAQALADMLARASAWADRYCFGADPAAKGSSLAATTSVESAVLSPARTVLGAEFRLVCDYKPILALLGLDIGPDPSSVQPYSTPTQVRFGRRTIYVPTTVCQPQYGVWSYVNGYPHTSLAASCAVGATSLQLTPTDGGTGLLGVYPGTRLIIVDGASTEPVSVTAVTGSTVTVAATAYAHTAPSAPDFLPVTSLPAEVTQAVIFLTAALLKTRGDNSLVLDELTEPSQVKPEAGDEFTDVDLAFRLLNPYRIRVKSGR